MSTIQDPRAILGLPTLEFGRELLGWRLVRDGADGGGRRVGRIVELEAYVGEDDRASHARFGETGRSAVMYGPPGRAYVYLVYGMHDCLNIVSEPAREPAALLVRAVEPLEGIAAMRVARQARASSRRRTPLDPPAGSGPTARRPHSLVADDRVATGPGLVCAAFDLDRTLTGRDLFDPAGSVRLEPPPSGEPRPDVVATPRVGIDYAGAPWTELPWRLSIRAHPSVSRPLPQPAG